jgi:hypothetical protein
LLAVVCSITFLLLACGGLLSLSLARSRASVQATQFNVLDQMHAVDELFLMLADLPDTPDGEIDTEGDVQTAMLFNAPEHSPKQLRHYKYRIISFISSNLTAAAFVQPLLVIEQAESTPAPVLAEISSMRFAILEASLKFVVRLRAIDDSSKGAWFTRFQCHRFAAAAPANGSLVGRLWVACM